MGKTFFLMKKIISFLLKMKYARQKTKLPDDIKFNLESWLAILRTSQNIHTFKKLKSISPKIISGISVASFRLSDLDSKMLFGSNYLPIVQDDSLLNKLITEAHTEEVSGLGEIHLTITATCARIKSNIFRVISPNLRNKVSKFVLRHMNTAKPCKVFQLYASLSLDSICLSQRSLLCLFSLLHQEYF